MREASLPVEEIYPFADDLIFSLFDTKSVVTENYIQDPVSGIKLFPVKSNSFTPTSASCCVLLNSSILPENNYEISFIFKFSGLTGTFLQCYDPISGQLLKINKDSYFKVYGWTRNVNNYTFSHTQGLVADNFYRFVITFGDVGSPITFKIYDMNGSIKISNANNDNNLVAKPVNNTTLSFGAASLNGVYSDAYQNQIFDLKITSNGETLFKLPLSEGYGNRVFDVINSIEYTINSYTDSCWNNKQDVLHYNFSNGYTLYNINSNTVRIPNNILGKEILLPADVTNKVKNYKGVMFSKKWNGCESLVKIPNYTTLTCLTAGTTDAIGTYIYNASVSRWVNTVTGAYIYLQGGTEWYWKNLYNTLLYYGYGANNPGEVATWFRSGGVTPEPNKLITSQEYPDLSASDISNVFSTTIIGVSKEVNLNRGLVASGDFLLGVNEGRWFIDDHDVYSQSRLCAYKTPKLNNDAIDIHKFVGNEAKLLTDGNLEYLFDVDGNPLWTKYR